MDKGLNIYEEVKNIIWISKIKFLKEDGEWNSKDNVKQQLIEFINSTLKCKDTKNT